MKIVPHSLIAALVLVSTAISAQSQSPSRTAPQTPMAAEHTMLTPQDIKWGPAPPSLPPGAQAAALFGDAGKDGLFALRLKLPARYSIAPHSHPKPEIVTVISGTFHLGMGEKADKSKATPLTAGSFFALAPGMAHYAFVEEETILQLNSTGPWGLTYVNPQDDPRKPK